MENNQPNNSDDPSSALPSSTKFISHLLKSFNVNRCHPMVIPALLELQHSYIVDILKDSRKVQFHCGNSKLTSEDIKIAIKLDNCSSIGNKKPKMSRDTISEIALHVNNKTMEKNEKDGIILPDDNSGLYNMEFKKK